MRSVIIGFVAGVAAMVLVLLAFQQVVIRNAAGDLDYRFRTHVFYQTEFPWSYLDQGRVITRFLFPVRISVTYYNAQYEVVTEADKPGRYGAVVRLALNGGVVQYRFITLYRTPEKVFWCDGPMSATAQFPPGSGIDPTVLRNQAQQIGEAVKCGFTGYDDESNYLAVLLAGLSETGPNDPPAVYRLNANSRDEEWWFGLRRRLGLIQQYPYHTDLPKGYDADPAKRWPLILFLHGGAQRGTNFRLVRLTGVAGYVAQGNDLPAIVVSPLLGWSGDWDRRILNQLLDEVCAKYRVDPDRVYMTGLSIGGDAAWDLALAHPERFAAIIPIAAESDPKDAARLKDIPAWAFHGMKDTVVPYDQTVQMVNGIRQAGGHAHLTLYPEADHDSWDAAYATDALYPWLLAQKRGQPEVIVPGVPTP